jgi:hypothetical protein
MHPRLAEEWGEITVIYPDARHTAGPERVEFTIELDPLQYDRAETIVAILIPPGYRVTGPDGFLIPVGLAMRSGEALPASDAAGMGMSGWLLMSFHLIDGGGQSTWRPTADPTKGDNIISFAASIECFIARGCN